MNNYKLYLFLTKLRSTWIGHFIVKIVFPHGIIEVENLKNDNIFEVNGLRLKSLLDNFSHEDESINLENPIYQDLPSN